MGGSGSKAKGVWPFSGSGAGGDTAADGNEQSVARLKGSRNATPFVFTRRSSLYYDEDGDLAHEFYEETVVTKNGRKKSKLKRIQKNLIPQGIVKLDHPCIHVDFPIVLCEVWEVAQDWPTVKCSHRYSSRSKVLSRRPSIKHWSCGLERKRKIKLLYKTDILNEMLYIWIQLWLDGALFTKIHILIFTKVVLVQVVCPLPSWHVSRIHQMKLYFSCEFFLQGKTSLIWKGFNSLCLLWDVEWNCMCLYVEWLCVREGLKM